MNKRKITAVITLIAAASTCLISLLRNDELIDMLIKLLISIFIFMIIGSIAASVIMRITKKADDAERQRLEAEAASLREQEARDEAEAETAKDEIKSEEV